LTEVFLRLNEHMEFERDVRERIKQAMRYPIFVMIAMAAAIVILNIFVIPVFAKVFAGFNTQLPLDHAAGLLGFSAWMLAWWPLLIAGRHRCGHAIKRPISRRRRGVTDGTSRKLKLPIIGEIILKATLARFARSFALVQPKRGAAGAGAHGRGPDRGQRLHRLRALSRCATALSAAKAFPAVRRRPACSPR